MRPSILLGRRTPGVSMESGAGLVLQMAISSNTIKIHGRVRVANPVTISHFLDVPHYYWGVGRPEWVSEQYPPPRLIYRPDGNSITTESSNPPLYNHLINIELIYDCKITFYITENIKLRLSCYLNTQSPYDNHRDPIDSRPTADIFPPERSIFLNMMIIHHIQSRLSASPVYIYMGLFF